MNGYPSYRRVSSFGFGYIFFGMFIGFGAIAIIVAILVSILDQNRSYAGVITQINPPGLIGPSTLIQGYRDGSRTTTFWTVHRVLPNVKVGEAVQAEVSWLGLGSLQKVSTDTQIICNGDCS